MKSLFVASVVAAVVSTTSAQDDRPTHDEWKASQADAAADDAAAAAKEGKMAAVNKVVKMLEGLQALVEGEGEKEAKTYNKFACFCKDTMAEKTDSIQKGSDEQATLSTTIDELASSRDELDSKIEGLLGDIEKAEGLIKEENEKRDEEHKKYLADAAEISGAIDAIGAAIQVIKSSGGASMVQMQKVAKTLREATLVADAMGHDVTSLQKATAFLQQAPDVPMEDYKSHSGGVVDTLEGLLKDFRTQKNELDEEEMKSRHKAETEVQEQTSIAKEKNRLMENAKQDKARATSNIAMNSQKRTTVSATLLDDQKYLSEMASMCQEKAVTWDQRTKIRADELSAITSALAIVKETVGEKTAASTIRLAQQGVAVRMAESVAASPSSMEAIEADAEAADQGLSFVQLVKAKSFLAPVKATKDDAISDLLWNKGQQFKSTLLTSLSNKIKGLEPLPDHFAKVKTLIEELISRLQAEAAAEAKQKGWCVKATSEAEDKRNSAAATIKELNGQMAQLEAQRDKLTEEVEALEAAIKQLEDDKEAAEKLRETEKAENEETVTVANEGLTAVKEAIDILEKFYDSAAKEEVSFAQKKGPADDAPDAGFDGGEAYKGASDAAGGVIGMLDVIKSDFERTVTETEKAEHQAAQDHEVFLSETKTSITEHTEAKKEKSDQLSDTESSLEGANEQLTSETETINNAVKELLELHGTCVDTAMSYEERVARREDEISALRNALCILSNQAAYGPQAAGMENC